MFDDMMNVINLRTKPIRKLIKNIKNSINNNFLIFY